MDKKLLELAVDIMQVQASLNKMSSDEIEMTLVMIYNTLNKIQQAEKEGKTLSIENLGTGRPLAEAGASVRNDPRSSIQEDKVICMECGVDFRQLTANHLKSHDLTPREYKKKWGFPLKQPLAARNLTKLRSRSAKKRGLPPNLQQYLENKREVKRTAASDASPSLRSSGGRRASGINSA